MSLFQFKQFAINQSKTAMKIGTDGVLLGAWATCTKAQNILDIGSGTGVIALIMAQRNPNAQITAIEIEPNAYEQMMGNFQESKWSSRINGYLIDYQSFETNKVYDLIISNPPFFEEDYLNSIENRSLARHTTQLNFEELIKKSADLLSADGQFSVIIPYQKEAKFIALCKDNQLYVSNLTHVRGKKESPLKRSLLSFAKIKRQPVKNELIIEIERHNYTAAYTELVRDFYLKM